MTLYLCTSGTSISTGPSAVGATTAARITAKIGATQALHRDDPRAFLIAVSAETNGLARCDCGARDEVQLLASDTDEGVVCAEAVAELVRSYLGARATVKRITGLVVSAERRFRKEGVANLLKHARAQAQAKDHDHVVFNVTGGFKGVVPYLTLAGMFENVEVHYVFDGSDELIRLPPLPVRFDHQRIAFAAPALAVLEARNVMLEKEFAALPPGKGFHRDPIVAQFVETVDDLCSLSAAGELAVAEIARTHVSSTGRLFMRHSVHNSALFNNQIVQKKLPDLIDPTIRSIPRNGAIMAGSTDLLICKPLGSSAPRIYYKVTGDDIYVVDIVSHDEHEFVIQPAKRQIWWNDYKDQRYDEINLVEPASNLHGESLAGFLDEAQERERAAEARASAAEEQAHELHKKLERREARDADAALPYEAAAWVAAGAAHRGGNDATGAPGIVRLIQIVATLARAGVSDPETLAAAWLFDAVERRGMTSEYLNEHFGAEVAALVIEVGKNERLSLRERERSKFVTASPTADGARLIALAEKIVQLRELYHAPPTDWDLARRIAYFDWAREVVDAMGDPRPGAEKRLREAFIETNARRPKR